MGLRWTAALLFLCAAHFASAVAGEAPLATDRQVLEGQIAAILSEKTVELPALEQGGAMRTERLPLTAPTDGKVLDETTAFFEECVLVVRRVLHRPIGGETSWRKMDMRLNLSLIEAQPERVRIRPPTKSQAQFGTIKGSVIYQWRPEVERRMEVLSQLAGSILEEAVARYPSDVATRLTWIAAQHEKKLVDKIYLDAGERLYYGNGTEISRPLSLSPIFLLEGQPATMFVELMHRYQESYCGERASA